MSGLATVIELGGATRHLRFDLNALAALEARLGTPLGELGAMKVSARNLRAMLWAGLLHEDKEIMEEQVGAWVDGSNFVQISEQVVVALAIGFGTENGDRPTSAAAGPQTWTGAMPPSEREPSSV